MRKIALTLTLATALFTQAGCAASDTGHTPQPVPNAGAGPAPGYSPLVPDNSESKIDKEVVRELQQNHYNKVDLDNAFSEKLFTSYVNDLDGSHSVFLASDIQRLKQEYGDTLDKELKNGNLTAAFAIFNTYQKRLIQIDRWALQQIDQGLGKLNLHDNETLDLDRDKAPWPANAQARRKLWTKLLENQVIDLKLANVDSKDIAKRLKQRYTDELHQIRQADPGDVFSIYMNAYTLSYDPHTDYFSPSSYQDFSIDMNLSLQGIGAELESKNGYAQLVRLIPGGPAAKSGQLKPTDRIIAVGQGKSGEFTDVVGMRLDRTVELIRGKKGSYVRLQVQPADGGQTKTVTLQREKIQLKDQEASSSVIHIKQDGKSYKIGELYLPSFYNGASRDVKKQLIKLKNEHVDGVIFDLRNNGGGALDEAMKIIGLFMDSTPGVQIRDSDGDIQVLGDRNDGAIYSGPLVVMVNRLSASASEIVAGALQDFGRALIVGSNTYGKGTVQTVLPLSKGQLKLTEAKFYRVTGKSTQDRGVEPGIVFPSAINPKKIGESASPNHLPYDTIPPTVYPHSDAIHDVLAKLRKEHEQRIANDPNYQYLVQRIKLAREESSKNVVSLNIDKRRAEQNQLQQKILGLANTHQKALNKPPYKTYKALEKAEDAADKSDDNSDDTSSESLPTSSDNKFDAYEIETAHILVNMVHALATEAQQSNQAAAA